MVRTQLRRLHHTCAWWSFGDVWVASDAAPHSLCRQFPAPYACETHNCYELCPTDLCEHLFNHSFDPLLSLASFQLGATLNLMPLRSAVVHCRAASRTPQPTSVMLTLHALCGHFTDDSGAVPNPMLHFGSFLSGQTQN